MKHLLRISLTPLAFVSFVLGLITGKWLIFGAIAIGLLVISLVYYSGRKRRIRYWLQGYKMQLEKNGDNEKSAIESIQKEFCASKYTDEQICSKEYSDIETLVRDMIKREFKFERLMQSSVSSQNEMSKSLDDYIKAVANVTMEIRDIKKELL